MYGFIEEKGVTLFSKKVLHTKSVTDLVEISTDRYNYVKTSFEAGTEKWAGWAKAKARQLRGLMGMTGMDYMARAFAPEAGTLIFIKLRPEATITYAA